MAWAKVISVQLLDPIVRPLCLVVQEYSSNNKNEEQKIKLLQTQAALLRQLVECLKTLPAILPPTEGWITTKELAKISEFISLPMRAILRSYQPFDETSRTRSAPLRSAIWKATDWASQALRVSITEWWLTGKMFASMDPKERSSQLETYLSVLISALPSRLCVEDMSRRNNGENALDRGEACTESLMQTLHVLIPTLTKRTPEPFVVCLIDSAISLVSPPPAKNVSRQDLIPSSLRLISSKTIETLLKNARLSREQWRKFFPALYTGLFGRILCSLPLLSSRQEHHGLVVSSVHTLSTLLEICLQVSAKDDGKPAQKAVPLQLAFLAESKRGSEESSTFLSTFSEEESAFFRQLLQRLPSSIPNLVTKLQAAKPAVVRQATLRLSKVLLATDHRLWSQGNTMVPQAMLETALVLSQDRDQDITHEACALLDLYGATLVTPDDIKQWITPRIVELIERLESYTTHGQSETELEQTLRILNGYVKVLIRPDSRRDFQSCFYSQELSTLLRKGFGSLLDIDLESPSSTWMVSTEQDSSHTQRLRYIRSKNTEHLVANALQSIALDLGAKKTALLIDSCIGEMYKSAIDRNHRKVSEEGQSQIQWLHEWIGTIRMVSELARGVLGASKRLLSKLFRSILPLLTTPPLWTFPLDRSAQQPRRQSGNHILLAEEASPGDGAYRGNRAFRCAILDCIGTFVSLLGLDAHAFVPMLLYPVLEQTSMQYPWEVKNSALMLLSTLATKGCGLGSSSALLMQHAETSLVPLIRSKLRATGGVSLSKDRIDVADLCRVAEVVATTLDQALQDPGEVPAHSFVYSVQNIVVDFAMRFDYLQANTEGYDYIAKHFLRLVCLSIQYLCTSRRALVTERDDIPSDHDEDEPWFRLLDEFRTDEFSQQENTNGIGTEEDPETESVNAQTGIFKSDTDFISKVIWRCCHLLSHPTLEIQLHSCEAVTQCFEYLGWVATLDEAKSSEANGPQTSVLRHIASSWPAVSAKLSHLCSAVTVSKRASLVQLTASEPQQQNRETGTTKLFLAQLFALVRTMTMASEDFMCSRLQEIVIPNLRSVLRAGRIENGVEHMLCSRPSTVDETLLLAAIECLGSIFGHRPTGLSLASVIPSTGQMLLPFLDDPREAVVSRSLEAIQHMIAIDGDSLYHSVLGAVGERQPPSRTWSMLVGVRPPEVGTASVAAKTLLRKLESRTEDVIG